MDKTEQAKLTRSFFDYAASGWTARYANDAAVSARKARFSAAVHARFTQPAEILDFGCGSGDIALHLAEAGHHLTGYDLSAEMIVQARKSDRDQLVRWIAQPDDSCGSLPFADGDFDCVVISSVLEYVPDLNATLKEMARVLRPGGWLFATVPDMRHPHRHWERWLQLALSIPGMANVLAHSRWREGTAYLRISINRSTPQIWRSHLCASGFKPQHLLGMSDPLMLLAASKE